jgi:pimeloyl-ACP methyl ester carboxylesterase
MRELVGQVYETGRHAFVAHQRGMLARGSYDDLLPRITCPTTVIAGREDIATTVDEMTAMARAIPTASTIVIERAAHMMTVEQPEATSMALRQWLIQDRFALAA